MNNKLEEIIKELEEAKNLDERLLTERCTLANHILEERINVYNVCINIVKSHLVN